MARTIESAGVEIKERDLSLNASLPVGTNIFVQGYAAQGPTDELVNVTSTSELEQIYGLPTNAAERYFYHTCKQVLDSPGNLLVTRLPYGSGDGEGYGSYSALIYPVTGYDGGYVTITNNTCAEFMGLGSASQTFAGTLTGIPASWTDGLGNTVASTIKTSSVYITVSANVAGPDIIFTDNGAGTLSTYNIPYGYYASGAINYTNGSWSLDMGTDSGYWFTAGAGVTGSYHTSYNALTSTAYQTACAYAIGEPIMATLTNDEYTSWKSGQIDWTTSSGIISSLDHAGRGGFIILNPVKTTIDERYQGYYVVVADNRNLNDTDFNAVNNIKYVPTTEENTYNNQDWSSVSTSVLEFNLTGSLTDSPGSISEEVESTPTFDAFGGNSYVDSIIVALFKVRSTLYGSSESTTLDKVKVEAFIGSLDSRRKWVPNGAEESFYIGNIINADSNYMEILVNPNIASKGGAWSPNGDPDRAVTVQSSVRNAFGFGPVRPSSTETTKKIGDIPSKLERSLRLAENKEQIPIDIVLDAGLSTIWANSKFTTDKYGGNTNNIYDDTVYLYGVNEVYPGDTDATNYLGSQEGGSSSDIQDYWETIFNQFNTFCGETRKDCLLISDALRNIFVQGNDEKVLSDPNKNFSQHTYWPLKNLYAASNSNYACTYGNWVKLYDNNLADFIWAPFSGFEAAIMARMDSNLQPWYAPAGLNNGIVRNIVDIGINPTQKQRDFLYRINVNPVVFFPGDGYTVWGQKTLQKKPSAFDRINVRRLFLTLEKATLSIMRYFVFEPNTVFTRTRVVNVLKPVFEIAKANEGVYDYLIVCDERNNTPDVIDRNELVVDIYLKPVRTAEFILVNFIATRTDQDFNELI